MNVSNDLALMTEGQFQNQVGELLDQYKWNHYHVVDSTKDERGFPDVVAWRSDHSQALFFELKRQPLPNAILSVDGQVIAKARFAEITADQMAVLQSMPPSATILFPSDLDRLQEALRYYRDGSKGYIWVLLTATRRRIFEPEAHRIKVVAK